MSGGARAVVAARAGGGPMKQTPSVRRADRILRAARRRLDWIILALLLLAAGFVFVDNYLPESGPFAGAQIDPASLESAPDAPPAQAE